MSAMLTDPRTGNARVVPDEDPDRDVSTLVAAARTAQVRWAGLTAGERSRRLLRFATAIEDRADEYVAAEQAGTGKPRTEAVGEIAQCVDLIRFYAGAARTQLTPGSGHQLPGRESWVRWEPMGVVAAILPWNYPLLMAVWRFAPALAAGNTVILKPAESTPDSVTLAAQDAAQTLGQGILATLTGDRHTGRRLVEAPLDAVAFTGSVAAGLDIQSRAGLRRVSLELGGNCPVIVLPDVAEFAYEEIVVACTYNAGQSCAAPARVITLRENYDDTIDGLVAAMSQRRAGSDFGPLNNPDQLARYDDIVARSRAGIRRVAEIRVGDGESAGYWRPGLILADLPPDDPAVTQEMFGPALTVQAVGSAQEAVQLANSVPQALAASVWGRDVTVLLGMATNINAGEVWVNCHLEQTGDLPHGGRKQSGHGTDLSVLALSEYQRPKTITARVA